MYPINPSRMSEQKTVIICNNCKFASNRQGDVFNPRQCLHEKAYMETDIVSGEILNMSCREMRKKSKLCGLDGKLYQGKDK